MTQYRQNGQYNLSRLELSFPNGDKLDITNLFIDISLYESLIRPTMSGSVSLVDTNNIYNGYMLGNGEEIYIEFETAGSNTPIKYHGVVYKTSPPTRVSEHSSGILLYFTSKELVNSNRTIVEDSFEAESSSIVKTLFNRIRNKKNIDITSSRDIHKFVSASHNPLDIIISLAGRSISTTGDYGYLFYENNREFRFTPIQELYINSPVTSYKYSNSGTFKDVKKKEEEAFNSIQDYEIVSVSDLLEQIDDGVYGSRVTNMNLLEKEIVEIDYDNLSQFDKNKSLGKVPNLRNNLINKNYSDYREVRAWPENEAFHKVRLYNMRTLLNAQRYAAVISVFGDTNTKVGDTIMCELPVWGTNALKRGEVPDPYSGKCLVIEIKHTIQRTKYTQTLKLVKDAYEVGY